MQALFLRFLKEVDARQLRFQRFESVAFEHDPRVYAFGYIRIDFRARELFQNGGALIRRRLQERGEPSLRKEHGAREAFEVHPCGFLHFVGHALNIAFEDLTRNGVGKFAARGLQFPGGFFPRPPLAPVAAERSRAGFEGDFGKTFPGLAGHDFVFAFGDVAQARRASVQGKAHGVEDGRLARTRGAGDDENAVRQKSRMRKINGPFPGKGIEVLEADLENAHGVSVRREGLLRGMRRRFPCRPDGDQAFARRARRGRRGSARTLHRGPAYPACRRRRPAPGRVP